jgi:hypothetical protein
MMRAPTHLCTCAGARTHTYTHTDRHSRKCLTVALPPEPVDDSLYCQAAPFSVCCVHLAVLGAAGGGLASSAHEWLLQRLGAVVAQRGIAAVALGRGQHRQVTGLERQHRPVGVQPDLPAPRAPIKLQDLSLDVIVSGFCWSEWRLTRAPIQRAPSAPSTSAGLPLLLLVLVPLWRGATMTDSQLVFALLTFSRLLQ